MASYLYHDHFDLVSPDGKVSKLSLNGEQLDLIVEVENISEAFVGFFIDESMLCFNLKSTLAQLGLEASTKAIELRPLEHSASVEISIQAYGSLAKTLLLLIKKGDFIGKLFAKDERRRVRDPDYLLRMFGRSDAHGRPLLSLGGMEGSRELYLDKVDGRVVAYLSLQNGSVSYRPSMEGFLQTVSLSLSKDLSVRKLLALHQHLDAQKARTLQEGQILLVKTEPLHIRTVFGRVVSALLPKGYRHTSASVLQPDTTASGDIYEFYGKSEQEIADVPLEFYTLEPHREYVFFSDRDQLQESLESPADLFKAFATAPEPHERKAAVFIVKGTQMKSLKPSDWVLCESVHHDFPGMFQEMRQRLMVDRYIEKQPSYPFLRAIEEELITSQGVLFTRYFPSPMMKRMLLSTAVQRCLKGIYFHSPSSSGEKYFSQEDRAFLNDLYKFAIPVFWVDPESGKILQYLQRPGKDSGMFVPLSQRDNFLKATFFGVYGSNLLEGEFEEELKKLLSAVVAMRTEMSHELLSESTPLALVTGGGPGAMAVGNRVAKELSILSCANIVDFRLQDMAVVNEQKQNPHIEAKMTYRLDKLVERQAEFDLDFPIFLMGGVGTDFEFSLEEVNRKVGMVPPTPILLFGGKAYWKEKVSSRFQSNVKHGTTKGSEWLSNCFHCVKNAEEGIEVYRKYFLGELEIGPLGPIYEEGFRSHS